MVPELKTYFEEYTLTQRLMSLLGPECHLDRGEQIQTAFF